MFCPRCDSMLVTRTPATNLLGRLLTLFSIRFYHCQSCGHRFRVMRRGARDASGASEHRTADRTPVRIPVRFEWGEGHGEGVIVDLSEGGCAIESKRQLRAGLLLRLQLPAGTGEAPDATAQHLVTVRSVKGDRAGVKFLVFSPQEQSQLDQTITQSLKLFSNE